MTTDHELLVKQWRADGMDWERITQKLLETGVSSEAAEQVVQVVKKERRLKNKNIGMMMLALGSALCFFSMTYTYFYGHSYFMLYGLTMIGVGIAFVGLVYVMG
jgi:hypothetical protein